MARVNYDQPRGCSRHRIRTSLFFSFLSGSLPVPACPSVRALSVSVSVFQMGRPTVSIHRQRREAGRQAGTGRQALPRNYASRPIADTAAGDGAAGCRPRARAD